MRTEPVTDKAEIAHLLAAEWGISDARLTFVPAGEYATCYRVDGERGRHFLKIWPKPLAIYVSSDDTLAMLRLTHVMHERRAFTDFAYPIATHKGRLSALLGGRLVALFPFFEGAGPTVSATLTQQVGRRLAELHRATSVVADEIPKREALTVAFSDALRSGLHALDRIPDEAPPARVVFRDLMVDLRDDLLRVLDDVLALSEVVRAIGAPFALCHRDIGWHNIIEGVDGRLSFVDWDDVSMAPPEHDLFFARGEWFGACIAAYRANGGTSFLHYDHFAFVYLRRLLDDLNYRLAELAEEPADDGKDAHVVEVLHRYILPDWYGRALTLKLMATTLREAGPPAA